MRFRTARKVRLRAQPQGGRAEEQVAALIALSYELLDAHVDTQGLATGGASDSEWENHLAYLQALQRVGREQLARADAPGR